MSDAAAGAGAGAGAVIGAATGAATSAPFSGLLIHLAIEKPTSYDVPLPTTTGVELVT